MVTANDAMVNESSDSAWSRFVLPTWLKAVIIIATLTFLFLTASSGLQRYGPLLFYLYGSLPFAYILTYVKTGKRITEENSTNVGVANSYNTAGMMVGTLTVIGEISKGLLPLLASFLWAGFSLEVSAYLLIGSLLGTNFSIFLKLKGGMGTTMMLWSFLFLSPILLVVLLVLMFLGLRLVQSSYRVAVSIYALAPVLAFLIDGRLTLVLLAAYAAAIFILKYRPKTDDFAYGHGMRMRKRKKPTVRPPQGPDTPGP